MPKAKSPITRPPTLAELAKALGITVRRVSELKKVEGMPCTTVAAAQAWRAARAGKAAGRADSAEELRQRRIALLRQQERRVRLDADRTAGTLIPKAEAERAFHQIGHMVRLAIQRLAGDLPDELVGRDATSIQRILRERGDDILRALADGDFEKATG